MSSENQQIKGSGHRSGEETIKETIESIVIAFVLAFVFRAYVVEAFVIPTGSMAPTLLGRHVAVRCVQCGYGFAVDTPSSHDLESSVREDRSVTCPMCHYPNVVSQDTHISAGDRILVHKYIYSLAEPKRWDVVVFKAPHSPDTNFIKRLVGLPNESLWIVDGNIYVRPEAEGDPQPWRVARKADRPNVQQAVWQPIYHDRYAPLDGGRVSSSRGRYAWRDPWVAHGSGDWDNQDVRSRRYDGSGQGVLRFKFQSQMVRSRRPGMRGGPGMYSYNQLRRQGVTPTPIEDTRLAAVFVPDDVGLEVRLRTTTRLDNPAGQVQVLEGRVTADGMASLWRINRETGDEDLLAEVEGIGPFESGRARAVELWYVDQQASLWLDGERVVAWAFELPMELVKRRLGPGPYPEMAVSVSGTPVVVRDLQVDRDLYYSGKNRSAARGAWNRDDGSGKSYGEPVSIGADRFFCLGDNSPMSHDSRYWDDLNSLIDRRMFDPAKPMDLKLGLVPRQLMMGRAFFVYWPAPLQLKPTARGLVLNFADMRFIH